MSDNLLDTLKKNELLLASYNQEARCIICGLVLFKYRGKMPLGISVKCRKCGSHFAN